MSARVAIKKIVSPFLFAYGLFSFALIKKVTPLGVMGFRSLFVLTNGRSNDFVSRIIGLIRKPNTEIDYQEHLSQISDASIDDIVAQIERDGCFIFEKQLPESIVDDIVKFSNQTPCKYLVPNKSNIQYSAEKVLPNDGAVISPRYQYEPNDIVGMEKIQDLVFNPAFFAIASKYLGCAPIFDRLAMWWSFPFGEKEKSNAAQMYHFDLPRIKWIKFFIYLTDVHDNNGPHCFVKGSHKRLPNEVRKDGRLSDEDVKSTFGKDNMLEITGKKGTIIAADTRGLHKGKPLVSDARLLLQLEYANSLFGGEFEYYKTSNLKESYKTMKSKYAPSFDLLQQ